eukprot:c12966_g1_i1 orf=479-1492(-)
MEACNAIVSNFCSELRQFCGHLDSMCSRLRVSVDQRPSSLSASNSEFSSFLRSLNDRVSSTNEEVEALEAMTIETISFQELLGHCTELYKHNQNSIATLEEHLKQYGYQSVEDGNSQHSFDVLGSPKIRTNVKDLNSQVDKCEPAELGVNQVPNRESALDIKEMGPSSSTALPPLSRENRIFSPDPRRDLFEDDPLLPASLSLQDLGLSAAGLACLAREESWSSPEVDRSLPQTTMPSLGDRRVASCKTIGSDRGDCDFVKNVSAEEFHKVPSFLKMQVSLEDLNSFIIKINSVLQAKQGRQGEEGAENELDLYTQDLKSMDAVNTAQSYGAGWTVM